MTVSARREITVLLAEDDENDVILARRAFERLEYVARLHVLSNSEQIIPYLRGEDQFANRQQHPFPDILLLDQRMPRISGLDILFWLRTEPRFEHLPVVVLSSAFSPTETDIANRLHGACTMKTVLLHDFPQAIRAGIEQAFAAVRDGK
jgi:CheY-like chemotaxis protein